VTGGTSPQPFRPKTFKPRLDDNMKYQARSGSKDSEEAGRGRSLLKPPSQITGNTWRYCDIFFLDRYDLSFLRERAQTEGDGMTGMLML
jgi:hypothetical protein